MGLSVQSLLQTHWEGFERRHRVPRFRRAAVHALATCKTAARGRHSRRCPHGHVDGVWYNSCRHRACPQCSSLDSERWLERRAAMLLPCAHYHLVFTLPSDLNELWQLNTKLLTELLFDSARWAMAKMLHDPRRLGARVGVLAVLHTWGRTLCLHPHLHCLLTAGGAARDGSWCEPHRDVLVACRPLGELFRGHFLRRLQALIRHGKVRLPPDYRDIDGIWLLRRCARKKWTPHISARYEHGRGVLLYLARYIRGGPLRNSSLLAADSQHVTFAYKNSRDLDSHGRRRIHTLDLGIDDFLSRLLLHIPKPHTRLVRGWGLYAHTQASLREHCRQQIGSPPAIDSASRLDSPRWRSHPLHCPVCGTRLLVRHISFCDRPPPIQQVAA
jgi:hypothetical protein